MFILDGEWSGTLEQMHAAWDRYKDYLEAQRERFPASAHALASSDWWYDFNDHRSPHDAWLEQMTIREPSSGARQEIRTVAMVIRLLAGYHDGYIEITYPRVFRYDLALCQGARVHGDWRYDEFRLSDEGHVVHEIEWATFEGTARWLIEASDVEYSWIPISDHALSGPEPK